MSKETEYSVEHQPELQTSFQDLFPEWSFGLLGLALEGKSQLRKLWSAEARQQVTSTHKNWDNTNHCRRFSSDAEYRYSVPEFLDTLEPNFETFTDEYCLGTPVKTYEFSLLSNEDGEIVGTNGINDAYQEDIGTQAQRFQDEKLAKVGKRQQRAAIETYNCERLDTWIARIFQDDAVPCGTKLIWCSPPGHLVEGYHGTSSKHHSFIWVYEKKNDGERTFIQMTQLRCWPNLKQIREIQATFQTLSSPTGKLPANPLGKNLSARNRVIAQMIELPPTISMEQVQQTIYAKEKGWAVQRSKMPDTQLSEEAKEAYVNERQRVLDEFLRPIYQELLAPPELQGLLGKPFDDPFWKSDGYRFLITQMDVVFAIAKQALDKWIENCLKAQRNPDNTVQQVGTIPVKDLHQLYNLRIKHLKEGLTPSERKTFNTLAPTVLSLGNRLLSVGQCGIGTVIPLNLVRKLNVDSLFSSSTNVSGLAPRQIELLSGKEKKQFQKDVLGRYAPFEVTDRKGQTHLFWVLKEYYADYAGHCYEDETGRLIGPCGVPLTMEDDEFILTNEKYQELLAASQQENETDSKLKQLDREEQQKLDAAHSDQERAAIRSHYARLRDRLKHRVSITELLNNDLTYSARPRTLSLAA